jgi:hypothetical protein
MFKKKVRLVRSSCLKQSEAYEITVHFSFLCLPPISICNHVIHFDIIWYGHYSIHALSLIFSFMQLVTTIALNSGYTRTIFSLGVFW